MSIITISRGSYSKGKEIAEKVADRLGYTCISREILIKASEEFNIPEIKLAQSLREGPSIWERLTYRKERFMAYIQHSLLEYAVKDNLVYHGLAGHFILRDISNVLKVRIIADLEDRLRLKMEREGLSREAALAGLEDDDYERRRWSQHLWGHDPSDPRLYDMMFHVSDLTTNDVAQLIYDAVHLDHFKTTDESRARLADRRLAARVVVELVDTFPDARATAKDGIVTVDIHAPIVQEPTIVTEVVKLASPIEGVTEVRVHIIPAQSDWG